MSNGNGTSRWGRSSHDPSCKCTRCTGFQAGHDLSLGHGAYATLRLAPRAQELADQLAETVPVRTPGSEAVIGVLSMMLAQLERANVALSVRQRKETEAHITGEVLDAAERDDLRRLAQDARGWANTALRYFEQLGLTPRSQVALGLDLVRTEESLVVRLQREARERERA